ncbi:MAG: DUF1398 family protein [Gammaproteobacteria bacterium]|nr:DUF1398 family protein [Gammaproteobacteria bacterium]
MEPNAIATIEECAKRSHDGSIDFGSVVMKLMSVGVESYHADYRRGETTYYLPNGDSHVVAFPTSHATIAENFVASEIQAAVRGAQTGTVKYPEFKTRTMAAGCVGYCVWIVGGTVQYFGRRGQVHTEHFPGQN